MAIHFTPLIARFVESMNAHDSAAFITCFAPHAIVEDEGHTHRGTAEIEAWIKQAFADYQPILEVASVTDMEAGAVITGPVSGPFPGSPVVLNYDLTIAQDRIAALKCAV
jgi:hypothetical protein